jgi:hypothetical protein
MRRHHCGRKVLVLHGKHDQAAAVAGFAPPHATVEEPRRWFSRLLKKLFVTPAKAGVQELISMLSSTSWIPAFAGMTGFDVLVRFSTTC